MIVSEKKQSICSVQETAALVRALLATEDQISQEREHFWTIGLNTKNVVQYVELVSLGSLNASIVHPRETYRLAVTKGVSALIFCHNHPSGDARPSQEDILLTKRLTQAGDILGIRILDHVIIGTESGVYNSGFFSFRENGLIQQDQGGLGL